jgi:GTP-binding protein
VILEVRPTLNTLAQFRHVQRYVAKDGGNGGSNNKSGKSRDDLIVPVPPGTVIYDGETGELIGDLTHPGQRLTI